VYVSGAAPGYRRADVRAQGGEEKLEIFLTSGGRSLSGVVLSPDGKPLAGASVVALVRGDGSIGRWNWGPKDVTDAEGRFEILGLSSDLYHPLAYHPETAFRILPEVRIEESDVLLGEVRLTSGLRVSGRLVNDDGEPLEGEIRIESIDGEGTPYFLFDRTRGLSDASGSFALGNLGPGEYAVLAQPDGFPPERVDVSLEDGDVDVGDIVFEDGLVIAGVVLDEAGSPVEGARVTASRDSDLEARLFGVEPDGAASETGSDGSFRLRGLDEGIYALFAGALGYKGGRNVTVEAGAMDVVVTLKRAGAIAGAVVAGNGEPVLTFHVLTDTGDRSSRERRRSVSSTADGRFLVEDLSPGEYALTVSAEGLKPGKVSRISVTVGETTDVGTIVLGRGGRIQGTVLDPEGGPVAGASVTGFPASFETVATSDARGRFELSGLEEGVIDLRVSHPDYADAFVRDVELRSEREPAEVRVELGRGGAIEGLVRDRDGAPLPGRTLDLERRFDGNETFVTGPDGSFRFPRLPAGLHRVRLLSQDPKVAIQLQERRVEVKEGETTRVVFESHPIWISGYVTKGGVPVAQAHVAFRPAGASGGGGYSFVSHPHGLQVSGPLGLNALTRHDGFYELYVDGPGEYRTELTSAEGSAFPEKTILIPDRESHEIDLDFATVTVRGRALSEESEIAVAGAAVRALPLEARPVETTLGWARTDESGAFHFDLEPGSYRIRVRADGFSPAEREVEVLEGSVPEMVLLLEIGGGIRGRVLDANGNDPGRYYVHAIADEGTTLDPPVFSDWAEIHPDGTFELNHLPDGRFNLLAGSDLLGFAFAPGILPGEELTLSLRPASRIELTVVDSGGKKVPGARVAVSAIGGRKVRGVLGRSDAEGKVELFAPPGDLEIKAVNDGDLQGVVRISAQENGRIAGEVVLRPFQPPRE
jgi:hypothetical protein